MMMQFKKYDRYKDSGVQWLGEIPEHWEVSRLRNIFSFSKGLTITKENLQEEGVYCVNYGEIHSKFGFEVNPEIHELKCVSEEYLLSDSNSLLSKGDFVFADTSEDIEGSGNFTYLNSDLSTFAGYHTVIARLKIHVNERFAAYVITSQSFRNQIRSRVKGVKVFSITQTLLKTVTFWFPNAEEQTAIANFLDDKTAKIDQAITQKEKLIALLKERKQILIQNAVTGKWSMVNGQWSMTPKEKLKDSGVEWIGQIPVGWEVVANRILFKERKEPGREDLPLLSVSIHSAVSSEELSDEDNIRGLIKIEDKSNYKYVAINDIVFNMMRAWQGAIGAVRVEGMVSPAYVVAKPNKKIVASYFEYQYRTDSFIQQMNRNSKGITDFRKRLYWDEFKQLQTVLPPQNEQLGIVAHIETQSAKIDQAITLQQTQIEKLKEYKATLIDSAVTGKIKVTDETSQS
ncbi:MAG: restriction endonuclease subunit S [Bacteroidia bacterium]